MTIECRNIDTDLSVAIATYNGSSYISKQIESIFSQSCLPSEIVICDDGSSDTTIAIIEELSRRSPIPIRLIQNEFNIGHAENFFKAATLTTTQYIAFCDQDDIWHPDKVKASMTAIRRDKSLMVIHNAILIDEDDRRIGRMEQCHVDACVPPRSLDPWTIYWGLTQIVDRKIFSLLPFDTNSRGYDSNNPKVTAGHDSWTSFVALTFGSITTLNADLVFYRQHRKNVYGFKNRSFLKKLALKITEEQSRVDRLAWLSALAEFRYKVIVENRNSRNESSAPEKYWERVLSQCDARYNLATAVGILKKMARFATCLQIGVYRQPGRGGLGSKRLIEDIIMGMLGITLKRKS